MLFKLIFIYFIVALNVFVKGGCPAGWLQNKRECYLFSHDLVTWYDASVSLLKDLKIFAQYKITHSDKGVSVIVFTTRGK